MRINCVWNQADLFHAPSCWSLHSFFFFKVRFLCNYFWVVHLKQQTIPNIWDSEIVICKRVFFFVVLSADPRNLQKLQRNLKYTARDWLETVSCCPFWPPSMLMYYCCWSNMTLRTVPGILLFQYSFEFLSIFHNFGYIHHCPSMHDEENTPRCWCWEESGMLHVDQSLYHLSMSPASKGGRDQVIGVR